MVASDNIDKNIRTFSFWFIPLIIVAKVVRWTIMLNQLVWMSMGHQMIGRMNAGNITPFHASLFSDVSNSSSVIMSNSEALFSAINIFGFTTYVEWEWFFSIVFNVIFYFMIRQFYQTHPFAGWRENLFIYLNLAILNIFCLNMAKEPLQLIVFLLMYWALTNFKKYSAKSIAVAVVLVLSVLYCRKYFALILMYFFVLQVVVRNWFDKLTTEQLAQRRTLIVRLAMLFVLFGVFHYFFLYYLAQNNEDTYDEMVSANTRVDTGAVSEIAPIFGGSRVMLAFDYFIKIFRLMAPVELLFRGKFTYAFLILYQALLAQFLIHAFRTRRQSDEITLDIEVEDDEDESSELHEEDYESSKLHEDKSSDLNDDEESDDDEEEEDDDDEQVREEYLEPLSQQDARTAALYLYLAFLLCSAAFEPDFGSWIRHEGVAFPVILLIL